MATKSPSVASLKKTITEQQLALDKMTKDLAQEKSYKEVYSKNADKSSQEIESIHTLLDVLPNALARKTIPDPEQSWNVVQHSLLTRFAAFLAQR